jgi:hypothetical protein
LSRHPRITCSRSKAVALIAAGAFTVATAATAATATAATRPAGLAARSGSSGPAAGHAHEADVNSLLSITDQTFQIQAVKQSTASQALQAYHLRDQAAELSAAQQPAAQQQAPPKQTARQAATVQRTAKSTRSPSAARVASGSPQRIAQSMLASFGWSSSQFSCLDPLWAHESGWSVTAYNAGSGAYGIPQALPGSRMASAGPNWQTSAATQIRWGLEYIKGTYGSPCAAWGHEQATGWY